MNSSETACRLESGDAGSALRLAGSWRLSRLAEVRQALRSLRRERLRAPVTLDGSGLREIDTAGALLLWHRLMRAGAQPREIALVGFADSQRRILELVLQRMLEEETVAAPGSAEAQAGGGAARPAAAFLRRPRRPAVAQIGAAALSLIDMLHGHLEFFGRVIVELASLVVRPGRLRVRELFAQFGQVCVAAIPVVALVTFLIGLVIAYLLGLQATQYGANIFVVDGVALGLAREFSPLIVATIIAGRSGASFTAQLGTMKLTEEIDAIRTLGLSPEQVLVVPRVLALVASMPLLVFVGDVFGGLGAMTIADHMLSITPAAFLERLRYALSPRHFVIGLVKAPVFAFFIAIIGCRMGISVSRDTRSIGANTTSTVVQSIVAVILLDALFAVLLQELGL